MMNANEIARLLAKQCETVVKLLLPKGEIKANEWRVGSVDGEKGKSLGVHLSGAKAGVWSDFATGQAGDLLDLWCILFGSYGLLMLDM